MDVQAIVGVVLAVLGAAFAVYQIPKWQVRRVEKLEDRIALENEARRTVAQILGGVAFLATLYFTWANLQITLERQNAERFTQAVKDIGSDNVTTRLSGIYTLESFAKESRERHWTIMKLLAGTVRDQAHVDRVTFSLAKRPDIEAILSVIGRRTYSFEEEDKRIDLRKTNLQGADLRRAYLAGSLLGGANLQKANLQKAKLTLATLQGATLNGANLQGAALYGAKDLAASQIKDANNWQLAFYSDDFLKELGLPSDHNEQVKKKLAELEKEKKATGGK